jgi:hypothetical protein
VEKDFHLEVIQVKEEREQKQAAGGFQDRSHRKCGSYGACHTGFPYTYVIHSVDSHMYIRGSQRDESCMPQETCWYRVVQQHKSCQVCL